VAALIWRFLFESETGLVNALLRGAGIIEAPVGWLADATGAWVPVVLGDVWKTSPFVALILLAGLQSIDREVSEAARTDGAGPFAELVHVTVPLLRPAIAVALVFRALDAFRVFDLVYVLTGGGPGVATEPVALYAFDAMLRQLRFGYGSALSVIIFGVSFALALVAVRLLGAGALERAR
jgi:ABC-type sugar transport system permease subunit